MHHRLAVASVACVLVGALAACSATSSAPTPVPTRATAATATASATSPAASTPSVAVPYPPAASESVAGLPSYPGPGPDEAQPTRTPVDTTGTPISGKGNVEGMLTNLGPDSAAAPMVDYVLFLAQILVNTEGQLSGIAGVDESTAPMAVTDASGQFVFINVEPGAYALAIKHPLNLLLARDVRSNQDIVLEVRPGQVTDLGPIMVSIGG